MKLRWRLAKLEARQRGSITCITRAQRDALDRLAGELLHGGEAETKARKELGNLMTDLQL